MNILLKLPPCFLLAEIFPVYPDASVAAARLVSMSSADGSAASSSLMQWEHPRGEDEIMEFVGK